MKDPRSRYIRFLLAAFLVTGALVFCLLPISYRRDPFTHVRGRASHIGERDDGEEIHRAGETDEEDLLLRLWREELARHPGTGSLIGRRK